MSEQLEIKDAYRVDESSFPYIFEENVTVPLKTTSRGIIRCNVYRPKSTKEGKKFPVLVTYGPYGKDIHYKEYVSPTCSVYHFKADDRLASTENLILRSTQNITPTTPPGKLQIPDFGRNMTMSWFAPTSEGLDNPQDFSTPCPGEQAKPFLMS